MRTDLTKPYHVIENTPAEGSADVLAVMEWWKKFGIPAPRWEYWQSFGSLPGTVKDIALLVFERASDEPVWAGAVLSFNAPSALVATLEAVGWKLDKTWWDQKEYAAPTPPAPPEPPREYPIIGVRLGWRTFAASPVLTWSHGHIYEPGGPAGPAYVLYARPGFASLMTRYWTQTRGPWEPGDEINLS